MPLPALDVVSSALLFPLFSHSSRYLYIHGRLFNFDFKLPHRMARRDLPLHFRGGTRVSDPATSRWLGTVTLSDCQNQDPSGVLLTGTRMGGKHSPRPR